MYFDLNSDIKVTGFGRIVQSEGFWHKSWRRASYILFYFPDGDLTMEIDSNTVTISKGDSLLLSPGTKYRPLESSGCVYYYFYFTAEPCEYRDSQFSISASHCTNPKNFSYGYKFTPHSVVNIEQLTPEFEGSRVHKVFSRCAELDIWQRPFEKMLLDNYLREILILLGTAQKTVSGMEQRFGNMVSFIQNNYKQSIGLPEVAARANLSESYVAKLFRQNSGMRCCDYINRVRLSAACEMLTNTPMRVSAIAEAVGYSSQYYFARQFKKVYGITALEFRRRGTE